ncbi:hypothetical protein SAMN05216315_12129 [Nitrosospira sp. Nsp18]|nr:hypothetical protein SAMN05216315_12129 [Nitrosospira sp. Nsp18]
MRLFIGKKVLIVTALVFKEPPAPDKSRYCRSGPAELPVERSSQDLLRDCFGSLSDLKEMGCKSVSLVHISPFFRSME